MESEEGLAARESMAVDLENEALAGTVDATDVLQMKTEYKSWEPSLEAEEVPEESSKDPIGEVLIQTWVLEEDRITEYNDNINDEEGINPEEANIGAEAELVVGTEPDGRTNNRVLQKLTRAPRYFDPPESSPQTYDKHDGVEKSKAHKTRKPCYICAEIGHDGLRCKKGHRVADCSNKNAEVDCTSRLCLKCGNTGHDMFTCTNGYDPEDLKAIKCYNCQKFGHLCCVEEKTEGPRGSSCYNCGQSGHFGSECTVPASGVLCSKCGDKCHPPDRCTKATSAKPVKKKAAAAAAATKAAKRRSRNARRRKRANPVPTVTAYQSQPNGWWIAPTVGPYYGNPGSNVWLSPAAAAGSNLNHQIGTLPSHQHIINNQVGTPVPNNVDPHTLIHLYGIPQNGTQIPEPPFNKQTGTMLPERRSMVQHNAFYPITQHPHLIWDRNKGSQFPQPHLNHQSRIMLPQSQFPRHSLGLPGSSSSPNLK